MRKLLQSVFSKLGWGLAGDALEAAVEVWQGMEPNGKGNFADLLFGLPQESLGVLNPQSREVVGEVHPDMFLELLAEIKSADVQVTGDSGQGDGFAVVIEQISLGPGDEGRFGLAVILKNPVGLFAELP